MHSQATIEMSDKSADDLVHELGQLIVSDPRYQGKAWAGISLVGIVSGGSAQISAYSYDASGKATPDTPRDDDLFDLLEHLNHAMAEADGRDPWKTCLVQIKRDDMSIKIGFDYQDPMRWKVTPASRLKVVEEMRPK